MDDNSLSENPETIPSTESAPQKSGFEWNLPGWFGASFGASIWMVVTPFFLSWPTRGVIAGVVGTLFVWSYAAIAWGIRRHFSAFKGIVGLLSFTVLANLGFLLFAHVNELPLEGTVQAIETNYGYYYGAVLLLFVSLLFFFWMKENQASK